MLTSLTNELNAGLPSLAGTQITAQIPISEAVLNELVQDRTGIASIEIGDSNVIVARVFGVGLKASIAAVESPLKVVLKLPFVARMALWSIRKRLPFIALDGDYAILNIAQIPQLAAYAHLMRHVRLAHLRTASGRLVVTLEIKIV